MRKIVWSQIGEKIIRPLILILLVLIYYYVKDEVSVEVLIWINIFSIAVTMAIALAMCLKFIGHTVIKVIPEYNLKLWIASSFTFFLADLLYNCNSRVSIFLLGIFQSKHNVGIFNITFRISETISFLLVIVNFVLSPLIANLYANGKTERLQILLTRSARIIFLIGFLLTMGIIFFRKEILTLFGNDFLEGQYALIVLCIGQFINILCGSVGLLLILTGNQRFSIYSLAAGTTINIILNLILTPRFGIIGTAISSAAGLAVWNLMMYIFVRKKLGIKPTAFGFI
jgi:O-antigen/teichoic acid export membrane protein